MQRAKFLATSVLIFGLLPFTALAEENPYATPSKEEPAGSEITPANPSVMERGELGKKPESIKLQRAPARQKAPQRHQVR